MLTLLQTEKSMKSTFSCHYGNTEDSLMLACAPTADGSQWKGKWVIIMLRFWWCLTIYRTFQAKDSMRNTFAIIAVTTCKSSMKPWYSTTTNSILLKKERGHKEGIRKTKIAPWCIHCSIFGSRKGTFWDKMTLNGEEIKPVAIAIAISELCLSKGIT